MKITAIGDLHGYLPTLPGGDLLIITGDLTASSKEEEYFKVFDWIQEQAYTKKILIAGNHDTLMEYEDYQGPVGIVSDAFEYLCDSGVQFEGLNIWGTPWTKKFEGMNPRCMAFTCPSEKELRKKFDLIPAPTNILISHGPPYGILDFSENDEHCGSIALRDALDRVKPKYHIFGHIHEMGGSRLLYKHTGPNTWCMNVSYVDEKYRPTGEPTEIVI